MATLAREHTLKPLVSARSQAKQLPWLQPGLSARRSGEISHRPQAPLQFAGGLATSSLPPNPLEGRPASHPRGQGRGTCVDFSKAVGSPE